MTSVSASASGCYSARIYISGLQYPANKYDDFAVAIYKNNVHIRSDSWTSSSSSTSTSTYIDGLEPGTRYWVDAYGRWKGVQYHCGGAEFVTDFLSVPDKPTGLYISSRSDTSIEIGWNSSSNAYEYDIYVDGKYEGYTSNTYYTITNLSPNTFYTIGVCAIGDGGESNKTYITASTLSPADDEPPSIWSVQAEAIKKSNGTYNVRVTWSAYDNEGIVEHWAYRSKPNYVNYESVGYSLSGSARSYTFTSDANGNPFKAGNRYHFIIRAVDAAGNISPQNDGKVYIDIRDDRPNDWSWSYSIYSGGSVYRTTVSGGQIIAYIMPASEWNRFTRRINEFRRYKGLYEWNFTTVSSEDNFTASRVNEAVNAINNIGFSISKMSYQGLVPARVFNEMRDCLNSIK